MIFVMKQTKPKSKQLTKSDVVLRHWVGRKSVRLESDTEDGSTNNMTKHGLLETHLNFADEDKLARTAKNKVLFWDENWIPWSASVPHILTDTLSNIDVNGLFPSLFNTEVSKK